MATRKKGAAAPDLFAAAGLEAAAEVHAYAAAPRVAAPVAATPVRQDPPLRFRYRPGGAQCCQVEGCASGYGVAAWVPARGEILLCRHHGNAESLERVVAAAAKPANWPPPPTPIPDGNLCQRCRAKPWATTHIPGWNLKHPPPWPRLCWACAEVLQLNQRNGDSYAQETA